MEEDIKALLKFVQAMHDKYVKTKDTEIKLKKRYKNVKGLDGDV